MGSRVYTALSLVSIVVIAATAAVFKLIMKLDIISEVDIHSGSLINFVGPGTHSHVLLIACCHIVARMLRAPHLVILDNNLLIIIGASWMSSI